jgi:hypothetical protein
MSGTPTFPSNPPPFPFPPIPPGPGIPGGPIGGGPLPNAIQIPNPKIEVRSNNVTKKREIWLLPVKGNDYLKEPGLLGTIESIPQGSIFYHWDRPENASRWARQGSVDPGEVAFLDKGGGVAGGGFYLSSDVWNSSSFGRALTVFKTTQPVEVLSIAPVPPSNDPNVFVSPPQTSITDWNTFNDDLKPLGVDGIANYSNETWYNMFDAEPLTSARAATWKDIETSAYFNRSNVDLPSVLDASTRIPPQDGPWLQSHFPYLSQLMKGQTPNFPDSNTHEQLLRWVKSVDFHFASSDLANAAKKYILPEIMADLTSQLKVANAKTGIDGFLERSNVIESAIPRLKLLDIPISSIADIREPKILFPNSPQVPSINNGWLSSFPQSEYIQKVEAHWAYQNHSDFLEAISRGIPIESVYDQPNLEPYFDRWNKAQQVAYGAPEQVPQILSGNGKEGMREGPASSDGDIEWPPQSGKKYFEINERQKQALQGNPFIHPEFLTIPDPKNPGRKIEIARYDYPTVADFEKFQRWIEDADLIRDLKAAKKRGWITDPGNLKTKELSKRFMKEVFTRMYDINSISVRHYILTSLHPFSTMNAESVATTVVTGFGTKQFYSGLRTLSGKPDEILLLPIQDYQAKIFSNNARTTAILSAFAREENDHPKFPKYFDVPEIWQVGLGISDVGPDHARFVSEAKAAFAQARASKCLAAQVISRLNLRH